MYQRMAIPRTGVRVLHLTAFVYIDRRILPGLLSEAAQSERFRTALMNVRKLLMYKRVGFLWPLLVSLCALAAPGCASSPAEPRMRLGSIPFPGPFTLYAVADPHKLGSHRYEGWLEAHDGPDEEYRGIMYTRRGGFLDLSHIRESADIVKYAHDRIAERLASGKGGTFRMNWSDTDYEIDVRLPQWWGGLSKADRTEIATEGAIRQAQRLAIVIGSWHELGTWYGQETIVPFSEKNSAFTWDDPASHVVAANVAGRALRDVGQSWNKAMTKELDDELAALGVVDVECEAKAVLQVHGRWWLDGLAIRRDLDTGLGTNIKTPWLVTGLDCAASDTNPGLPLPEMGIVGGHDLRELFEVRVVPKRWLMRAAMGCEECPDALVGEQQVVDAIERLRVIVKHELGPEADQP
jgi:hypothetical protein